MKLRLAGKKDEGDNIWSYFFEPIEPTQWIAGQSIRLEIPRSTYGVDERRFSIASAPHEKHLQITTKLSGSSFKQSLAELDTGNTIDGYNIEGDFVWGDSELPRLFLAAGIGITPFRAMIAERIYQNQPLNTTLLYGSRIEPLFKDEFAGWSQTDPTLTLHYLAGGRIAIDQASSLAPFWKQNLIYISGPEQMVLNLIKQLEEAGVQKNRIHQDLFTGRVDY